MARRSPHFLAANHWQTTLGTSFGRCRSWKFIFSCPVMHLQPYVHGWHYEATPQLLRYTDAEKNVACAIHYSLCSGKALMQFSWSSTHFRISGHSCTSSYAEPSRQATHCGSVGYVAGGFYISRGEKFLYYERIASGESEKACQEVGARASFEHNLQSDEVWKLCKWAYKNITPAS